MAQRRAQSQRDKAANRPKSGGGVRQTAVVNRAFIGSMGNNPRTRSNGAGSLVVTNTESFQTVALPTSGATVVTKSIVPSACSWLAGVASSYSKYRWRKLRIFYIPAVSTATNGRLAMGLSYDPLDTAPTTVDQIVSMNRATFGPVWAGQSGFDSSNPFANRMDLVHLDLDVSKASKPWYNYATTSTLAGLSPVDRGIYLPAILNLGADSGTAAMTTGSLYISYEVELTEPTFTVGNQ